MFRSGAMFVVLVAMGLAACSSSHPDGPSVTKADQPFAQAGIVEMQLDGGDYTIRAASDEHIRVSFAGNTGGAAASLAINGTRGALAISDTPHNNFRATVEVPSNSDVVIRLKAGNLRVAGITGNKDIDSKAGNVAVTVGSSKDYARVDASVTVGDISAGPFGESASGIAPHLKWSGPGKYTLKASLGAGNLELKE